MVPAFAGTTLLCILKIQSSELSGYIFNNMIILRISGCFYVNFPRISLLFILGSCCLCGRLYL